MSEDHPGRWIVDEKKLRAHEIGEHLRSLTEVADYILQLEEKIKGYKALDQYQDSLGKEITDLRIGLEALKAENDTLSKQYIKQVLKGH